MKKILKFPGFKDPLNSPKILSMDEYYKFVMFNLKYAFDKKAYTKWKKLLSVDVPFTIAVRGK